MPNINFVGLQLRRGYQLPDRGIVSFGINTAHKVTNFKFIGGLVITQIRTKFGKILVNQQLGRISFLPLIAYIHLNAKPRCIPNRPVFDGNGIEYQIELVVNM